MIRKPPKVTFKIGRNNMKELSILLAVLLFLCTFVVSSTYLQAAGTGGAGGSAGSGLGSGLSDTGSSGSFATGSPGSSGMGPNSSYPGSSGSQPNYNPSTNNNQLSMNADPGSTTGSPSGTGSGY